MIEIITAYVASKGLAIAGVGIIGLILNFLLKRFVTEGALAAVGDYLEKGGYYVGKVCTLGLSHWRYTKPVWNNVIEPYVVLFVEKLARIIIGLVKGLQSDNPSTKE